MEALLNCLRKLHNFLDLAVQILGAARGAVAAIVATLEVALVGA